MKKNRILLKGIHSLNEEKSKKMIGLIGTHQGVGVTHTSIMLANFMSGVLGNKTAFLEVNTHNDFQRIENMYYNTSICSKEKVFKINKVHYYKAVKETEIVDIFNEEYECLICDFGFEFKKNRNEFLRCDQKLVIGSLTEWKRDKLIQFISKGHGCNTWNHLVVFGQGKEVEKVRKQLKIKLKGIEYNPDPYILSNEIVRLFQAIC